MAITMDGIFVNGQKVTFHPENILSGDASAYTEEIGTAVEEWLEENVTGGEQVTDTTLTLPGVPADSKKTGDEIGALKAESNSLGEYNCANALSFAHPVKDTHNGITYTYNIDGSCTITGTASNNSFRNIYANATKLPIGIVAGGTYPLIFTATNVKIRIYFHVNGSQSFIDYTKSAKVTIPSDCIGLTVRYQIDSGKVVDETVQPLLMTTFTAKDIVNILAKFNAIDIIPSTDKSDSVYAGVTYTWNSDGSCTVNGTASANSYNNIIVSEEALPFGMVAGRKYYLNLGGSVGIRAYVYTSPTDRTYTDYYNNGYINLPDSACGLILRFQIRAGAEVNETVKPTLTAIPVGLEDGVYDNIYNTYNITTSPTITTDANGWLQAIDTDTADETGKTDMTGPIMSMLTDTGYCHLGEGIYYVSGSIDMPDGSTLCGCGKKTVIRLLQSTASGYCVKIGKHCTIRDVSFEGARSFSVPSTKGTRNGIAFMAEYDASPSVMTEHCMISNVWIRYFSGAGIYCHNTSINYAKGVYVSNALIHTCYVGIDIDYYSEFNKFTNVCTAWCKIGCVNNGGNNVFTSCTFHATDTGFYIDGLQPNSAHGTITGCTFCHIGSNTGKAIHIKDSANGFVINACQIFYNSVNVENSSGVVISNCEFGRGTTGAGATITISGGNTVMIVGCVFMNDDTLAPDITITNNTKVKFVNCYGSVTGNAITA